MRVLHWLNTYLPDVGGIQTFCGDLLPRQVARGHEVHMLTSKLSDGEADREQLGPITVHRVDSLRALRNRNPGDILRSGVEIGRIVAEFEPEVLHMHPCGPEAPYFARLRKTHLVPTVATLHNNYGHLGLDVAPGSQFGDMLGAANRIAACSENSGRWLAGVRPDLADRTTTVHNGLPDDARPVTPEVRSRTRLMTACRVEEQKRLDVLLDAFDIVAEAHPTVVLQIVGDGTGMATVRSHASRLSHADRIEFTGKLPSDAVLDALGLAGMFVMSSDYEGMPIALLEAIRQGLPTAATAAGGVPEAVLHGRTGLLVQPGDVAGLADAISTMLADPELAHRFGIAAREHFVAAFSLERCVDAYEALYLEAVDDSKTQLSG